ncbi:MAG TPA: hypothetical protein VF771_17975, partial [Longimicrobiaceae bacterium]
MNQKREGGKPGGGGGRKGASGAGGGGAAGGGGGGAGRGSGGGGGGGGGGRELRVQGGEIRRPPAEEAGPALAAARGATQERLHVRFDVENPGDRPLHVWASRRGY